MAAERGPIVCCVEHADLDGSLDVDDMAVVPAPITVGEREVTAIPFSAWGNRALG
ncbi:hypothetical protein [Cellulomonas fengjieae]|uniref:hypothetical protein n=1 Tax=Cellulomonas fengjieae TaxID=2819978 RepID=UPI001AAF8022|nr:hypothetical protein [Cellulomonas fengjieae]